MKIALLGNVTLDFLAQGNDGMLAFKKGRDVNAPASDENNVRFIIMKYLYDNFPQGLTKNQVRKALKEILRTDYDW